MVSLHTQMCGQVVSRYIFQFLHFFLLLQPMKQSTSSVKKNHKLQLLLVAKTVSLMLPGGVKSIKTYCTCHSINKSNHKRSHAIYNTFLLQVFLYFTCLHLLLNRGTVIAVTQRNPWGQLKRSMCKSLLSLVQIYNLQIQNWTNFIYVYLWLKIYVLHVLKKHKIKYVYFLIFGKCVFVYVFNGYVTYTQCKHVLNRFCFSKIGI